MPVFSVIIPVYKVEEYLPKCVESVLHQTFVDFEMILIDDGSPDESGILCDCYAKNDSRIRVVHKKNGGLSSARNCGLQIATGEYIVFLDSDDYWDKNDALELIYREIERTRADVVLLKHRKLNMKNNQIEKCTDTTSTNDFANKQYAEQLEYCVTKQLFDTCAWNKVFRRDLINKRELFFVENIISEDLDWAARLSLAATSLAVVTEPVHVYRKGRAGSITTSLHLKNLIDTKASIERCLAYVQELEPNSVFLKGYYGYVAYRYVIWMAESAVIKNCEKNALVHEMKQYDWLLRYDLNRKVGIARRMNRILGFSISSKLLGLYLAMKR